MRDDETPTQAQADLDRASIRENGRRIAELERKLALLENKLSGGLAPMGAVLRQWRRLRKLLSQWVEEE